VREVRTLLCGQMHAWGPANLASGMRLLGPFALLAAGLTQLGIVGITADSVTRRTPEIGIRTAMGARRIQVVVLWRVNASLPWQSERLPVWDFSLLGVPVTRKVFFFDTAGRCMLPGTGPTDLAVIVPAAIMVSAVATAFTVLAARRASRIDPAVALRPISVAALGTPCTRRLTCRGAGHLRYAPNGGARGGSIFKHQLDVVWTRFDTAMANSKRLT